MYIYIYLCHVCVKMSCTNIESNKRINKTATKSNVKLKYSLYTIKNNTAKKKLKYN